MRKASLFSGIGGIDLAAHWAALQTVVFCEREPFPQRVLRKHWPDVPIIDDVHDFTREELERRGIIGPDRTIDLISAGYPCQPFSHAGKREGSEDDRHLWPEVKRILAEVRPRWFIGENVAGHITLGLDEVLADLEDLEYTAQAFVIPAASIYASHQRKRVFIVAYTAREFAYRIGGTWRWRNEHSNCSKDVADSKGQRFGNGDDRSDERKTDREVDTSPDAGSLAEQTLAHSTGERRGEAREHRERSASRVAGCGEDVADASSKRLSQRGRTGGAESNEEKGAGMESGIERCSQTLADADSAGPQECHASAVTDRSGYRAGCSNEGIEHVADTYGKPRSQSSETAGSIGSQRDTWDDARGCSGDGGTAECGGAPEPGLGRITHELSTWLDGGLNPLDALAEFIGAYPQPALMGQAQHDWEPPRVATGIKNRSPRLKALGNAVNPLQILPIMYAIKVIDDWLRTAIIDVR